MNISKTFLASTSALAVLGLLTACGGGGNSADPVATTPTSISTATPVTTTGASVTAPTIAVSGKVLNVGYLGNTLVCADIDNNGLCGSAEPSTTSAANGSYTLTVPTGHRGVTLLAVVRPTSVDSAATATAPISFAQGWTWGTLLEYEDDSTAVTTNITPITATYYARMRLAGRNRLSNQIAMFTRIVYEANVNTTTGALLTPVDFDYVASPRNTLADRLRVTSSVLSARAATAAAPLDLLNTTAVMAAWYNTYTAPTATAAAIPSDASKIAALASTSTSTPEYYVANDYHYFRPHSETALRLRNGLAETAGWLRTVGTGNLASLDRRATVLSGGAVLQTLSRWVAGVWTELTSDEGAYYTQGSSSRLVYNSGTDYLQPRAITYADGNRVSFRMPNNNVRWAFEVSDSPGTNFFIEEWVGEQRSYATYYNGAEPATPKVSVAPAACNKGYPGAPQTGTNINATTGVVSGTTASAWYATCYDYYTAEYYDKVKGDLALKGTDANLPGANFYDAWLKDALLVAPLKQTCGTAANPMPTVSLLGKTSCNWAVDALAGHTLADLFSANGVTLNSWTKVYGDTTFGTTVRTAGTAAQAGLPQQLKLTLARTGSATSGTGTLYSEFGAWTATSFTATTEAVQWEISAENANLVLISMPFRDINDPRVKANTTATGGASAAAPLLPAGHFTAVFNGNTFSVAPATHTAPNLRKLAVVLQDGVFVTGQYYGKGFTYNERYFTVPAMEEGMKVMNYVFAKLYAAGFTD